MSGINVAIHQRLLSQLIDVLEYLTYFISVTPLNLAIKNVVNLQFTESEETVELFNWSIRNLNFRNVWFDKMNSNFVFLEPTQEIKLFLSDIAADIDFLSRVKINPDVIEYEELKRVRVSFEKMTFSLSFKIVNNNQRMFVQIKKVTLNGSGDNIRTVCADDSFFLQLGCTLFDNSKFYFMQNINTLLIDFLPTFNIIAEVLSEQLASYFIPFTILDNPLVQMNMELIDNEYPQVTPNPIIFDNFLSLKFEGQIYPNARHLNFVDDDQYQSQNYLPLYFVESQDFQMYFSQQTFNQMLFANQYYSDFEVNFSDILDSQYNCTTKLLSNFFGNVEESFGYNQACQLIIRALNPINVTITAGDIYVDPNYYQLLIFVNTTEQFQFPEFRHVATIEFEIKEIIISAVMKQDFIQYFSLKNFIINQIYLAETANVNYHFDNTTLVADVNTLYKDIVKFAVNFTGQQGIKTNTTGLFGEKYNKFWTQSLPTLEIVYKDQYYQMTTNFQFKNTSLFEALTMDTFTSLNNTDMSSVIKEYDKELNQKIQQALNSFLLDKNVNMGTRKKEQRRKQGFYENLKQQMRSDYNQIIQYFNGEGREKRSRIKTLSVIQ